MGTVASPEQRGTVRCSAGLRGAGRRAPAPEERSCPTRVERRARVGRRCSCAGRARRRARAAGRAGRGRPPAARRVARRTAAAAAAACCIFARSSECMRRNLHILLCQRSALREGGVACAIMMACACVALGASVCTPGPRGARRPPAGGRARRGGRPPPRARAACWAAPCTRSGASASARGAHAEMAARPLRIMMSTDFFYPDAGGVECHVYSLAQGLIARGHAVCVLTRSRGARRGVRWMTNGLKVREGILQSRTRTGSHLQALVRARMATLQRAHRSHPRLLVQMCCYPYVRRCTTRRGSRCLGARRCQLPSAARRSCVPSHCAKRLTSFTRTRTARRSPTRPCTPLVLWVSRASSPITRSSGSRIPPAYSPTNS